jgi:hypothetical protein
LHVPAGPFVVNAGNLTLIICLVNRNFDFYPQAFCHIDNSNCVGNWIIVSCGAGL